MGVQSKVAVGLLVVVLADARAPRRRHPRSIEAPEDIPTGNDDDIVARQLREAAMREPDPEIRKALWDEYRKYKGLEIPNE
jgi:hypothetical protein